MKKNLALWVACLVSLLPPACLAGGVVWVVAHQDNIQQRTQQNIQDIGKQTFTTPNK